MSAVNVRKMFLMTVTGPGTERVLRISLGGELNEDFEETGSVVSVVTAAGLNDEATCGSGIEVDVAVEGNFGSGRESGERSRLQSREGKLDGIVVRDDEQLTNISSHLPVGLSEVVVEIGRRRHT
jgi:hypothetical protein